MKTLPKYFVAFAALVAGTLAADVTITESATDYLLTNGVITARVLKRNGDLASLKFRDAEMLTDESAH